MVIPLGKVNSIMKIQKLSVVIPAYNEARTIDTVIRRAAEEVKALGLEEDIIVVDDGSTDNTKDIVLSISGINIRYFRQAENVGKGAALKRGFEEITGEIVLIQDADLEYDPADYKKLLNPIRDGKADVVYGSRFHGDVQRVHLFWHYLGNKIVTTLSNIFTNLNLTDMETGYKAFRREVIDSIRGHLRSKRFGIEPELTARIAHGNWRVYEVPVNYFGRTYAEGKKIGWWDGVKALFLIVWFSLFDRR
ncbi:MAG: family 2 glycosyl transferase [Parcubacteria group bacterium Gr01-1014_70]|nr:MAG: family 2 glycosyl transferase [Parcubacteria group bacterium Gr01-1014_70]